MSFFKKLLGKPPAQPQDLQAPEADPQAIELKADDLEDAELPEVQVGPS